MELSNIDVSRILFGFTAAYHFLFVPVTIGLMAVIALFEGCSLVSGKPALRNAARLLSRPFLINFICGLMTGYPLRAQINLHWAGYAEVVQHVVTSVFAFEAQVAPWLFGLVAVFALGWRLKPLYHWLVSTMLAAVLILQSCAILMINAWMQRPSGTTITEQGVQVDHLLDLADNPLLIPKIMHTIGGAWVLGGFIAVAIAAWYLLRQRCVEEARASLNVASGFTLFALIFTAVSGHWGGERLVQHQPMKFAAIEALWDSDGASADLLLFAMPDQALQSNHREIGLPGLLARIVVTDQPLRGLRQLTADTAESIRRELDYPQYLSSRLHLGYVTLLGPACCESLPTHADIESAARRALPNVATVFWSFRVMLLAWTLMLVLVLLVLWRRPDGASREGRMLLRACVWALPLPWVAIEAGWLVCEVGRQPWTVTGLLSTRMSGGAVTSAQSVEHLVLAVSLGAVIPVANVKLNIAHLRRGFAATPLPHGEPEHINAPHKT